MFVENVDSAGTSHSVTTTIGLKKIQYSQERISVSNYLDKNQFFILQIDILHFIFGN